MKMVSVVLVVVAVSGGLLGYSRYAGRQADDEFVRKTLDRGPIIQTVSATGTIEPVTKVIVGSQVSGKIVNWYADFNDLVTEGFVLAELDPDRFRTAYNQAKAEVALAKAAEEEALVRFKDAERERKRIEGLMDRNTASENELLVAQALADAAQATWHGAQAGAEAAEAMLNAAKVDLDRTIIRSPIDGVVITRNIDVGQTVAASLQAPELFLIANNLARMQVNANVSEADIGLIAEGRPATFRVDAYPDREFSGVISQIRYNATILEGVVTYVTLIEVHNDDLSLRPGMTANVTFEVARVEDVVRIPNAALRFSPMPPQEMDFSTARALGARKPQVWVLSGGSSKSIEVETGLSDGTFTQLVAGDLKPGDEVITDRNWRQPDAARDLTRSMR